ncbi:MAG: exopolysaccharide biosynthesis protein [Balneolaceae bacterium]
MDQEITSLGELLGQIKKAAEKQDQVSLGVIFDQIGHRSFAPFILLAGLITLAPIVGDIPGVPSIMAVLILLTAGQLIIGREHFWLPDWLLNRSIEHEKLAKALDWIKRPAKYFDRISHKRLEIFTNGNGTYIIAVTCVLIALVMPFMEVIPFSANGAGAALTAFGLALISKDGFIALIALLITATTFGVVIYNLIY